MDEFTPPDSSLSSSEREAYEERRNLVSKFEQADHNSGVLFYEASCSLIKKYGLRLIDQWYLVAINSLLTVDEEDLKTESEYLGKQTIAHLKWVTEYNSIHDSFKQILHHQTITMAPELVTRANGKVERKNTQSCEERNFQMALIMTESHFSKRPPIGPRTLAATLAGIRKTMDKTLNHAEVREVLAKNVDIWMRLNLAFHYAVPFLGVRSMREAFAEEAAPDVTNIPESSALIAEHYNTLVEDLTLLNNLLVIGRNMLAVKEVAQDICATVHLDTQVIKLIVLCVNVTSKGYDGENVDSNTRLKLNEVTELYKKLLVTALQFLHNLTMGNDRLKMAFWFEMLFDNDLHNDAIHELPPDGLRVDVVYQEVRNWLRRNSNKSAMAEALLATHEEAVPYGHTAGHLPPQLYDDGSPAKSQDDASVDESRAGSEPLPPGERPSITPVWQEDAETKYEQDSMYSRVSHELDVWWKRVRDANYEGWVVPMETVESAMNRAQNCKNNAMTRYIPRVDQDADREFEHGPQDAVEEDLESNSHDDRDPDNRSLVAEDGHEELEEDEEDEDDDSYVEGPLRGLLTEIPNILDTKQIEALHMTVKACVVDAMGSGLTKAGENLQKTRCKMFLALDCGKNLLREMLVFIAVWEQTEHQFIFQITAQIIESFHHNALLPYAWDSLRILKDIVSPAQTVLLRLINYMFRARKGTTIYNDPKDYNRDAKLVHFLFRYFRCRVVPDCLALIYAQSQIRNNLAHPQDFPVDLWDMERAKDGLSQYLNFISVIAEIPEMRHFFIEWKATYELITLLNALDAGVARKPLVAPIQRARPASASAPKSASTDATVSDDDLYSPVAENRPINIERPYDPIPPPVPAHPDLGTDLGPAPLPALHDTPHKYAWQGIKVQILVIFATLVQPVNGRSGPGNPDIQKQVLDYDGIMALLNCCVYDGNNEYLKERATLALKWVMEGCDEAQNFVRELSPLKNQAQNQAQSQGQSHPESRPGSVEDSSTGFMSANSFFGVSGSEGGSGPGSANGNVAQQAKDVESMERRALEHLAKMEINARGDARKADEEDLKDVI